VSGCFNKKKLNILYAIYTRIGKLFLKAISFEKWLPSVDINDDDLTYLVFSLQAGGSDSAIKFFVFTVLPLSKAPYISVID
jgi:hypothetical protein